ncbi:hypothetical protein A3K72_02010 [Candidatus Woesearchaeota archaeon RBG_13_36_6]|nr:MAG: hypothetical protein A3K72_02010 [Candidatus Woesearchaeota archaeon RBG_13_36_6]
MTKSQLAIVLSKLEQFKEPNAAMEQYTTDAEIASQVLWNAYMLGDIKDKIIADLGCGTGTLGIGALLLGAKWVLFLDIDSKTIEVAKRNLENIKKQFKIKANANFMVDNISNFNKKVEVVIQNPPFGVQQEHADKLFLEKGFEVADIIYSFHKIESKRFIEKISKDNNFKVTHFFAFNLPLKMTMDYHTRRIQRIRVGCWRLEKQK